MISSVFIYPLLFNYSTIQKYKNELALLKTVHFLPYLGSAFSKGVIYPE